MGNAFETESVDGAAEAYLRLFAHNDVDYFFNSPGSDDAPYWEYLEKYNTEDSDSQVPQYINCRHESLAVNMARGYTMVTGKPQVVKLHINTGTLHAGMDLHAAYHTKTPMIVLSSYSATHEGEQFGGTPGSHYLRSQEPGGHENNVARYTKWYCSLETNDNAEQLLTRAFNISVASPQGPVFVNISRELAYDSSVDTVELIDNTIPSTPFPDPETLESLIERLENAENPLILTSTFGSSPEGIPDLVRLAEKLNAPVFETKKRINNFPTDHPLYIGASVSRMDTPSAYFDKDIDLVLVLDSVFPWYPPQKGAPTDAEIIMVNTDTLQEKSYYWNYPSDMLIEADSTKLVSVVADRIKERNETRPVDWKSERRKWIRRWETKVEEGREKQPIDPFWLCHVLNETIPDDAIVHHETIVHTSIIANLIEATDRDRIQVMQANRGGLGVGLGVALGAKLAQPDRTGVLLIGDGSYNYNTVTAAFGAAQEHNLPILVVVFNNGSYESMRTSHRASYPDGWAEQTGNYLGSQISPDPDYAKAMETWGGYGERVEDPELIEAALQRGLEAVNRGDSALIDVALEKESPAFPKYD